MKELEEREMDVNELCRAAIAAIVKPSIPKKIESCFSQLKIDERAELQNSAREERRG